MRFVLSFLQGSVLEYAFCTRHNSPLSIIITFMIIVNITVTITVTITMAMII